MLLTVCMAVTFIPMFSQSVSAITMETPTITSLTSEYNSVTVTWGKTNNPAGSYIEVVDCTHGQQKNVLESVGSCTFSNLQAGETVEIMIRSAAPKDYGYYTSSYTPSVSIVVYGGSNTYQSINLNTWYSGTTTEYPELYKIKTTGRSDSKYKFFVRTTYAKISWFQTAIEMAGTGKTLGYCAYETPDRDIYAPPQSLKANSTYEFKVFGEGSSLGYEPGVNYDFIVKEIIATPAKGKVTSWKGGKKKATLKFAKLSKATRYQVACKKKGGSYKYRYTTKRTVVIKNLSKKKYYYVKVRGQRKVNGKYYSGKWSEVKKTKVK